MMRPDVILLVEDEAMLRQILCETLEDGGFLVENAATADAAWAMVDGGLTFDILVTDVQMPGEMDGLDLARRVSGRCPDVRIIVMSGFTSRADFDRRLGKFLRKPFTSATLAATITSYDGCAN
ncbi:response regulator [Sphingobium sufflavum]|uniref:response regulator n=1 Tax=Sphingobium sufflavum TaxID=1129547 RepID=UPI001F252329|nr:response regulator [Sphingobium sufflavum]MCE7796738.1 response regulator [Sphingobium sufflavum]